MFPVDALSHSIPTVLLILACITALVQHALKFNNAVKQADFRNFNISNVQATRRYRVSGLLTAALVVMLHLLSLLWLYTPLYHSHVEGVSHHTRLILHTGLAVVALLLYHNSRHLQYHCVKIFWSCLGLACISRAIGSTLHCLIGVGGLRTKIWSLLSIVCYLLVVVVLKSARDILPPHSLVDPTVYLLPKREMQGPISMGNPFAHSLLSRLTFSFTGSLIAKAGNLCELDDLPPLGIEETCDHSYRVYEELGKSHETAFHYEPPSRPNPFKFEEEDEETSGSFGSHFFSRLVWFSVPALLTSGMLELFQSSLYFMQPLMINRFLAFLGEMQDIGNRNAWTVDEERAYAEYRKRAIISVLLLSTSSCAATFLTNSYFNLQFRLAVRLRTLLITLIYRKIMRHPVGSTEPSGADQVSEECHISAGQVVNMISSDVSRVEWAASAFHSCWGAILQMVLPICLLYSQLGWTAFSVIGVMIVGVPLANLVFRFQLKNSAEIMKWKDKRLAMCREIFQNAKCVKLFAWEPELYERVASLRNSELKSLWRLRIGEFLNNTLWNGMPIVMSLTVFGLCAVAQSDNKLTVQQMLTAFAILNMISFPLSFLPLATAALSEGLTTLWRLKTFLTLPEQDLSNRVHLRHAKLSASRVVCQDVRFTRQDGCVILRDLSFRVPHKSHVGIVGPTGCGKTTLLELIIGALNPTEGSISVYGTIAYCAQSPWLQAGTIRSNILFGRPMDRDKYDKICEAVCLKVDFDELADRDRTRVGERGCTLSGGQRQRIALARALYSEADLYVLDDVLSAVDHRVAQHICTHVLGALLKGSAVVLVTHRAEALQRMDYILTLSADGVATWSEASLVRVHTEPQSPKTPKLRSTPAAERNTLSLKTIHRGLSASPSGRNLPSVESFRAEVCVEGVDEVEAEKIDAKAVPRATYTKYYKACGGLLPVLVLAAMSAGSQGFTVYANVFLSAWSNLWAHQDATAKLESLLQFSAANGLSLALLVSTSLLAALLAQHASRYFHYELFAKLLNATLTWLETVPPGSILNRFSQDIQVLDERLPGSLLAVLQETLKVTGILFVTLGVMPLSVLVIGPLMLVYRRLLKNFVRLARQMQRLDTALRSPLVTIFSESVEGLSTIKAFGASRTFVLEQHRRLNNHVRASYFSLLMNRWLGSQLEMMRIVITLVIGLLCVYGVHRLAVSTIGLAMSYCMMLSGSLAWLIRIHGDRENNIVSVDRITTYSQCPQEGQMTFPGTAYDIVLAEWPSQGAIVFKNVVVKYTDNKDQSPALNGVSFEITPGKKVAVIGRTGAGKTTMLNCLFRLIEYEGDIVIDGVELKSIPLRTLRSRLAIIPQDPITLSGTIQDNLDPFHQHTEEELHAALDLVGLKTAVEALPLGAKTSINDGSFEFSAGQKQLLCFARVLLKKTTRILILDEATSSIDPATDAVIQKLIRQVFHQCTILTIAHRITTILDYDLIVGMDKGQVKEVGSPDDLLSRPDTLLSILKQAAETHEE
eukprot:Blabericola_migrator_1__9310@NODE_4_length_29828_cov_96_571587_g3_i0_p3_GENE_NODE_4_length_29828_cov_96_571587_g3_i0NODE_4_length_29828_cov_96_571587_g3_i0_p3_ORF_typecomplete_len1506_score253_05ABC_tran/PF00005_27/1e31ABC_tran/PF00005_27/6_6e32ABC_membrane/PF00664_23/4_6e32ABC_membrane/PF00664_23/7_1e34SMC_N/PF02463_19/0_047SMC_N/PF02463_19/2_5e06SMC_N/PF02463_19/92SMC_N/PF02463_19/4_8T2SSE/PF00437_20/0_0001T2SSE/PF00437_20/0_0067AAA_22/PF13401_6/0_0044AAA_22/PF13401_6/0_013AAA_29/PF13555_6/0_0